MNHLNFHFPSKINVLIGENAQGKTNIMEASMYFPWQNLIEHQMIVN